MNTTLKNTTPPRYANFVMAALIVIPIAFTMIMWSFLPSGYQRTLCKKEVRGAIQNWQPLQAGLKFVVSTIQ